jgi:hypothetical protein
VLCGADDGAAACWLFECGGPPAWLPLAGARGAEVTALDWSRRGGVGSGPGGRSHKACRLPDSSARAATPNAAGVSPADPSGRGPAPGSAASCEPLRSAPPHPHPSKCGALARPPRDGRSFHAVAACSLSPYAPVRVSCADARLPPPPAAAALAAAAAAPDATDAAGGGGGGSAAPGEPANGAALRRQRRRRDARGGGDCGGGGGDDGGVSSGGAAARAKLPERLTPDHVHALLFDLRAAAAGRGLYKGPPDPDGDRLVVPEARAAAAPGGAVACGGAKGAHGGARIAANRPCARPGAAAAPEAGCSEAARLSA